MILFTRTPINRFFTFTKAFTWFHYCFGLLMFSLNLYLHSHNSCRKIIVSCNLDINIYVYILTFNLDTLTFLTLFRTHNREYGPLIVFRLSIHLLILTTNEWSKWSWSLLEYFFNNCLSNPTLLIFCRYTFYNLSQSNNVIIFLTI